MNDFIEKPITAEVRALVHEVVDRFLDYNPTRTRQEITGSKPTFFVTLWGHICTFEVSAHVNGYGNDSKHEYLTDFAGMDLYAEDSLTQLKSVLERMEEIYTAWYEKEHPNE